VKTKTWVVLLSAMLAVCLGLSLWLLRPQQVGYAQVWSDGKLIHTLDLQVDKVVEVKNDSGSNRIEVRDGKIAVTEANCPDHHCINRGFCSGGVQIVCLPNRLVIRFVGATEIDGVAG
jgi:hypothetical protein